MGTDAEIQAMQSISDALSPLDEATCARVLKWALARHVLTPARTEFAQEWAKLKARSRAEIISGKVLP